MQFVTLSYSGSTVEYRLVQPRKYWVQGSDMPDGKSSADMRTLDNVMIL